MKFLPLLLISLGFLVPAAGQIINFEAGSTTTAGVFNPSDNLDLSSTIFVSGSVEIQFSFVNTPSIAPTLEDANLTEARDGSTNNEASDSSEFGFVTSNDGGLSQNTVDTAANGFDGSTPYQSNAGPNLGSYFLRGSPTLQDFDTFVIDYVSGSSNALAFQIWDIDGINASQSEEYTVTFLDSSANVLGTVVTPEITVANTTSLDALPYLISFTSSSQIERVEITFTGTKTANIGLAFDNFNPINTVIPEPSTMAVSALFLILVVWFRRRAFSSW